MSFLKSYNNLYYYIISDNVFSDVSQSEKTLSEIIYYYMNSDNVFSDWLTSLVTFFDKTL